MKYIVDIYWSMRSPFCYLALDRILALEKEPDVTITIKHVWPGAMRTKGYFKTLNPNYPGYHTRDSTRLAEFLDVPYARPNPDPVLFDKKTREPLPLKKQPHIGQLTRIAQLAEERNAGIPYLDKVMRLIWNGEQINWHLDNHLARAVETAGLNFKELAYLADTEAVRLDAIFDENNRTLNSAGHWGVPCAVFQEEPFFGQDRLNLLNWRLNQARRRYVNAPRSILATCKQ